MSRIGRSPIALPSGVVVEEKDRTVTVKGPKGALALAMRPEIDIKIANGSVTLEPSGAGTRAASAYHGMTRALLNNMVHGVTRGYERTLEIVGVGWNAQAKPKELSLNIGFCHPVVFPLPDGITCECPNPTTIIVKGVDKQAVGQFAAVVRKVRPPEPYKGKGIRYQGEQIRRKAGKTFGS